MDLHRFPSLLAAALPFAMALGGANTARISSMPSVGDDTLLAWRVAGRSARATRDTTQKHGGSASGHLVASTPAPDIVNNAGSGGGRGSGGSGGNNAPRVVRPVRFEQTLNAIPYRERRLRVSLWVRTQLPDKPAKGMPVPQAYPFIEVDNEDATLTSYDGSMSPLFGANEWTRKVMVIEVPPDAFAISFGIALVGPGEVWVDDVVLEDQSAASGTYNKQPRFSPEQMARATPEQVTQGKEMYVRRIALMKERPAEVVNGDFEAK